MFGALIISYLFCGGAGAGALAVGALASKSLRVRVGFARYPIASSEIAEWRAVAKTYTAGGGLLLFGIACLVADLGRDDRIASLFLFPHFTFLTVGAFALAMLVALGAYLMFVSWFELGGKRVGAVNAVETVTVALGLVVALYTGLLLAGMQSVALWATPLLPALFLLSSASCGCAVFLAAAVWEGVAIQSSPIVNRVLKADACIVTLEAICAAVFLAVSLTSSRAAASASALRLFAGNDSTLTLLWWIGFVLCGIAVPFVFELVACVRGLKSGMRSFVAIVTVLVLVGSASMRAGIVMAGDHPDMGLVPAAAMEQIESAG